MGGEFTGIGAQHFDAYEERKWSSNRFNLERMRVRERIEELCRPAVEAFQQAGEAVRCMSTPDHPSIFNKHCVDSQYVLILRSDDERRRIQPLLDRATSLSEALEDPNSHHQQVVLSLRLDLQGVEVACRLHRHAHLDWLNFQKRLQQDSQCDEFVSLCGQLPEAVTMGVGTGDGMAANQLTIEAIQQWREPMESGSEWWVAGRMYPREDSALTEPGFAGEVHSLLSALWPLFQYVAWTNTNDFVGGVSYLETLAAQQTKAPDPNAGEPDPKSAQQKETQSGSEKRSGKHYRPDWDGAVPTTSARSTGPVGPSARARQRKAEEARRRQQEQRPRVETQPETSDSNSGSRGSQRSERGPQERNRDSNHGRRFEGDGRASDKRKTNDRPPGRGRHSDRGRATGPRNQRSSGKPHRKPVKKVRWVDAEGDIAVMDHARISGGLLNGKVGQVVEITKKGHMKVVVGDMAFEVKPSQAIRVLPE
jgi:hypothetical protein